jgi:hypothetical protein
VVSTVAAAVVAASMVGAEAARTAADAGSLHLST